MKYTLCMSALKMKTCLFAGLFSLLLTFPFISKITAQVLTDITKPYLGTYECRVATLDEKEYLQDFSYIRLELKKKNTFYLRYCTKDGAKKEKKGKYKYNKERHNITFYTSIFPFFKREFPLENGVIYITIPVGEKNLRLLFEQQ